MLEGLKGSDVLLLDAGNALFRVPGVPADEAATKRAQFVLATMAQLGIKVMAAGHRDLNGGTAFLAAQAKKNGVQVLSANLEQDGKRVFEGSAMVTAGGLKVALIGVTAAGALAGVPGAIGKPTLEAVNAELAKLGKRDLTVVLAATTYADATQLATELKGKADIIIGSGEPRGTIPPQRFDSGVFLLSSGQKGQAMGELKLDFTNSGPFVDLDGLARDQYAVTFLEGQVKSVEGRLALAKDPQAKKDLGKTLGEMKKRLSDQRLKVDTALGPTSKKLKLDWAILDASVKDDPQLKQQVLTIEPTYEGAH